MAEVVPNADGIVSGRKIVGAAPQRFDDIAVPDDMAIAFKAHWLNAGVIYIARSSPDGQSIETIWPLLPNEPVAYRVKNAASIWYWGTTAGDSLFFTVEQRSGGRH